MAISLIADVSWAQKSKGANFIQISMMPKYYFNKTYIDNDDVQPNPIHAKNTIGYAASLEYERITKRHIIIDAGLEYGIVKHRLSIVKDFSNYDPDAVIALKDAIYRKDIDLKFRYISPRLLLGYKVDINNKWAVVGKVGGSLTLFFDGYNTHKEYYADYTRDDGTNVTAQVFSEFGSLGDNRPENQRRGGIKSITFSLISAECYVGLVHTVEHTWIKNLSVGLLATHSVQGNKTSENFKINSYEYNPPAAHNQDLYTDRNFSLGLKIGVGLWK